MPRSTGSSNACASLEREGDWAAEAGYGVVAGCRRADEAAGAVSAGSDVAKEGRAVAELGVLVDFSVARATAERLDGCPLRCTSAGAADLIPTDLALVASRVVDRDAAGRVSIIRDVGNGAEAVGTGYA